MAVEVTEVTCKSALTGSGGSYRLNPYVGCQHACVYCYATYIARWRGQEGPWGSWVQAKTNIPEVLARELRRRRGVHIMLSTVCDIYQPVEEQHGLTRRCLTVLAEAARQDPELSVFVLTKSELVRRDLDVLNAFPAGQLRVGFSVTTARDDVGALLEPGATRPSRRLAAARGLREAGLPVGLLFAPVLPYVTERELPRLIELARQADLECIGFDPCNYLDRQVGAKLQQAYHRLGRTALARLRQAREDPGYAQELQALIQRCTDGGGGRKPASRQPSTDQ
ncbi:MAG: radical SAM protein [Armatimonadetes bacterium]|nr:radical SAM protein [Armatimonadota bacterium]